MPNHLTCILFISQLRAVPSSDNVPEKRAMLWRNTGGTGGAGGMVSPMAPPWQTSVSVAPSPSEIPIPVSIAVWKALKLLGRF